MKHWNRIWNSEHLHTLFVVYVPFLLFFISLPMAFFPQTKVFLVGFACLLLAIMVQYAGSYRIWIFLTFLLLLCYIISANYLGVKFYEICVNSILLTLLSLFSGSRLQSTEYEQLRSRQENALSKQLTERNKNLMSIRGMDAIQQQLMRDIEDTCGYPTAFFSVTGELTPSEYQILALLARSCGNVVTYKTLTTAIWGPYADENCTRTLRVNMANIRRKLETNPGKPQYIITEMGIGYRIASKKGNE